MKSQEDVEKILSDFGKAWPESGSIVEGVMQKIESLPVRQYSSNRRRIIMKSMIGIAASLAVIALIWWGVLGDRNSLYAQVIEAVHKARTFHTIQFAQPKDGAKPIKATEQWFERGVGFRMEGFGQIRLGNDEYIWSFNKDRNIVTRSQSNGIDKATMPIFAQIDQLAQELQNEYERYPKGDQEIDHEPCKAYLLTKTDRIVDSSMKSGERRGLIYLDQQSRLVRGVVQRRENDRYNTESYISFKYDEPIDPALFKPDFGKDVKIIDADEVFDEFVNLKTAIYVEERSGIIYAIHRVERFENGCVLVVSSVRGTEETLKKYPLTKRPVRPGQFLTDGPATNPLTSQSGGDTYHMKLADATHQGIDVSWWAMIPSYTRPDYFEVAPGRMKIHVFVMPHGEFANLFRDKNGIGHDLSWDIEVNVPGPTAISTTEEIAKGVYADQVALEAVPFKFLCYDESDTEKSVEVGDIAPDEYARLVARDIRSLWEHDVNFQLEDQFEPKRQKEIRQHMGDRVAIGLMYNPAVDDTTLERVAKRDSVTDLYLQGTHITDGGLKHLSNLTKLERLNLSETGISDAGLRHLTGLTNLKQLNLMDSKVTAEGVAMLKKEMPGVEIKWKAKEYGVRSTE